jgi:hypothetical protein
VPCLALQERLEARDPRYALSTMEEGAARRYYESLLGSWSGRFSLAITDGTAAAKAPFAIRTAVRFARVVGGYVMSTTLRPSKSGDSPGYVHTTRVSSFGVPLFATEEVIVLHPDGRTFQMRGTQRPLIGADETYAADGEIDAAAKRATYQITWAGAPLVQRTTIVPEGLELSQDTAWSTAFVLLRRTGPSKPAP